jgi:hypothetical protein
MAGVLGAAEAPLAAACRAAFARGQAALDTELWNGEYYQQVQSPGQPTEQSWGTGCHADQLLGQWWAHVLDLGHVLSAARTRQAVLSIARHNFRERLEGHVQRPRVFATPDDPGLLNCTWPRGGRPAVPLLYSDEVWSGLEYEVAGLLLFEAEPAAALRLIDAVRRRYDGRKQNPWNHVECGDHYVRATSAWVLLEAAAGYHYDAGRQAMAFAPVLAATDFRGPFVAAAGWGTYAQQLTSTRFVASLRLAWGSLALRQLRLRVTTPVATARATLAGQPLTLEWIRVGALVDLRFEPSLVVSPAGPLHITLESPA